MKAALARWLQRRWYGPRPPLMLLPLAAVYGAVTALRRLAYRRGWVATHRVDAPVIVVGNLTVGGGGKTPLVMHLARLLVARGHAPAVLSRGYGGRHAGNPLRVHADTDPDVAGDEAVLMAARTGVPVYVHADRVRAARAAIADGARALVCDDGLQHYRLARDLAIVVVDGRRRFGNGALLPAGPLREPAARLNSVADRVVCKGEPRPGEHAMRRVAFRARPAQGGAEVPLAQLAPGPVHAVAGIADPEAFFADLRAQGLEVRGHAFADHHRFGPADLAFGDGLAVLMTAKDAVKCRPFAPPGCWCVEHDLAVDYDLEQAVVACVEAWHGGQGAA